MPDWSKFVKQSPDIQSASFYGGPDLTKILELFLAKKHKNRRENQN